MLKLYTKSGCVSCIAVLHKLEEYSVPFEELNISLNNNYEELVKIGGEEVPHLVDLGCSLILTGEAAILSHLEAHKTPKTA